MPAIMDLSDRYWPHAKGCRSSFTTAVIVLTFALITLIGAGAPPASGESSAHRGWSAYRNSKFGFELYYPTWLFRPSSSLAGDAGKGFATADGSAEIIVQGAFDAKTARHRRPIGRPEK